MFLRVFPVAVALAIAIGVFAELAFTRTKTLRIADALAQAETPLVTLHGRIIPTESTSAYILDDGSGRALILTCPSWYRRVDLSPNETVTVTGELENPSSARRNTLFTVSAHSISRSGKPEIVLRTQLGKPPWALGSPQPRR